MADKHILSLEIPKVANCNILSIKDTSKYSSLIPIDCPELLITVPGYNAPVLIEPAANFDLNLNACDLNVQTSQCGTEMVSIPDGVYIVKYSVSPNDKVYVEYNTLRICNIMCEYHEVLCHIDIHPCEPDVDKKDLIDEMHFIRTLIDAAVAHVEYCTSPSKGMELYDYALKKLRKLTCRTKGC